MTLGGQSLCTAQHSVHFFNEGILPPPDIICQVDATPFGASEVDQKPKTDEERAILQATTDTLGWLLGIFV